MGDASYYYGYQRDCPSDNYEKGLDNIFQASKECLFDVRTCQGQTLVRNTFCHEMSKRYSDQITGISNLYGDLTASVVALSNKIDTFKDEIEKMKTDVVGIKEKTGVSDEIRDHVEAIEQNLRVLRETIIVVSDDEKIEDCNAKE